ncbi:MAG: FAD-dependent oxidoreductase [Pseudomonadota bacterium]
MMHIAIIGAGLAGLTLASRLRAAHTVTVFEKARGSGGRMSTRRADPYAFDHGAQYFTQRSEAFGAFLQPFLAQGLVQEWPVDIHDERSGSAAQKVRYVAVPGMNTVCKALAATLNVYTGCHIERLQRSAGGWSLSAMTGESYGPFDWVISSAPAPQTAALLPSDFTGQAALDKVKMAGCFALMLGFEAPLDLEADAFRPDNSPIGWAAVNASKPGRPVSYSLLIQSTNVWAEAHLEERQERVQEALLDAASSLLAHDLSSASHQVLHRWRYAATPKPAGAPFLLDEDLQLAACGDWCLGSKVEAAFESADALAQHFEADPAS